jgi:hypothetical protein
LLWFAPQGPIQVPTSFVPFLFAGDNAIFKRLNFLGRVLSEVENLLFASKIENEKSTSGEKRSTMRMKLVIINKKGN